MNKGDKVVSICNDSLYEVNRVYVISDTRLLNNDEDKKYLQIYYGDEVYMNFWFKEENISDYFIPLADARELQIKSVLED